MSRQPRSFLGATRRVGYVDKRVTQVELEHGIYSGVKLKSIGDGMVPMFEEHEARLERGIGLDAWGTMPLFEKALLIAHRRVRNAMSNLQTEAEMKDSERRAKRRGKS